ncbi:MAG: hypothetical protein FJ077_03985 [Cyanobacteria bacterium K_DeepCast_35m_m2_023]|nr:hypothetical protein [Cyanobacteria bacterium K_DeepCast_35m_m2_023]
MPTINVRINSDLSILQMFSEKMRKQSAFAMSRALNRVAPEAKASISGASNKHFDSPTPFIVNAWRYTRSSKTNLEVVIYPEARREPYLRANIASGRRGIKPFEAKFAGLPAQRPPVPLFVPTGKVRKDSRGNVSKGTINTIIKDIAPSGRGSVFVGKPRNNVLPYGIYRRMGSARRPYIRPLFVAVKAASYERIFPIQDIGHKVVERRLRSYYAEFLQQALATAR